MIKKILKRASAMGPSAGKMLRRGLIISCILLVCSIITLIFAGSYTPATYYLYQFADSLFRLPITVLLLAVIGSAVIEDMSLQ